MGGAESPQDGPSLASLLTNYMDERGLTQGQLAARAGIAPATLSRWLNRKWTRPYHREGVLSLAVALGLPRVSTNRLLRAAGLPPIDALARSPSGTERALLERWVRPVRNNLPADLTSFVGRDAEVTALAELLLRDDVRLVTLTGTGGSGKTRLALRVAEEGLDAFPDGVYFVPLVPVTDPALLLPSIAEAVGLREVLASTILGQLASWLQRKQVLLLLDNLEQLLDGAPVIAELLRAAPGLRVLATSRVPLHLSGEHEWPVDPFPVPDPGGPRRLLRASEAVELFRQRARAANARRALDDDEELAAMAELCARLDGLPLAIELAAARTRDRSPERLLAEFPGRLDVGSTGPRDVPPRQQTLRAAIDWSLDLLPAPARTLLARLSTFSGGWTEEAAVAVCAGGGVPAGELPGWLSTLADASLVVRAGSAVGVRRYRMLETIREYGAELLARTGETAAMRARHARFFVSLAESAPPYVPEVREGNWYDRVEEDLDNVRAALAWSAEQDDPEMLAR
ncbi:MAG TPA: NB-ARC domain-containing protein, partial [Thermomicrobiaceae bacterium]|nr:NB-ARC domain-containing protein [Thermomicrobiaceae bacterium]